MSKVDLVIVHPGAVHGLYGELGYSLVAVEPPLFARLIAGYCIDRGFSVAIIDAEAERIGAADVAERIRALDPRLICIAVYGHQPSASTQQMVGAGATAHTAQGLAPIIMVGGHPSAMPARTLRDEAVDFVCKGEGPVTVHGLLAGTPLEEIPGLVWLDGGHNIRINAPAPLLDVSELHGDVWDLLPMHLYTAHNWHAFEDIEHRQPYASIYTSLGCPYRCEFCCINSPFGTNAYRMRAPGDVVNELIKLRKLYDVRNIKITDELFVLNRRHVEEVCKGIIEAGLTDLNIWAYARVDTVKIDMLPLMRKAGIRWLALGIESASAETRLAEGKGSFANNPIFELVRTIQDHDISVIGNYIFGLPGDTRQSMRDTLKLAKELGTEFANFYSAMAYPGSVLFDRMLLEHLNWLPQTWDGYSQHAYNSTPLPTDYLTSAEILRFRDEAFVEYFEDPGYRASIYDKFGSAALQHVVDMTRYRLKRRLLDEQCAVAI